MTPFWPRNKSKFQKADFGFFQDGQKSTSGANFVNIYPKIRFDPILSPLAPLRGQNGVKKLKFRKSESQSFQDGQKPTSGSNFVKIGPKIRLDPIGPIMGSKWGLKMGFFKI